MRRSRKLLVLLAAALFAGAAAEAGVRVLDARRGYSARGRTAWYWLFRPDAQLGHSGRPHAALHTPYENIRHSADGFRDDRTLAELRAESERRLIVCVGDAATYGLSADSNAGTFPALLERELRRVSGDARFVVFNAGMISYTSREIRELLRSRLLDLRPEAVLSMSFKEDFEFLGLPPEEAAGYNFYPLQIAGFFATPAHHALMHSSFYGRLADKRRPAAFLDDFGMRRSQLTHERASPDALRAFLDNVSATAELVASQGSRFVYVDQAIHYSNCSYSDAKVESAEGFRRALHELCRTKRVPMLAAHTVLDWSGLRLGDDNLPGTKGYERLARLVAPQLLAVLAPPAPSVATPR